MKPFTRETQVFHLFFFFINISLIQNLNLKKDHEIKQANIPSSIVIAMDIPAYGLKFF